MFPFPTAGFQFYWDQRRSLRALDGCQICGFVCVRAGNNFKIPCTTRCGWRCFGGKGSSKPASGLTAGIIIAAAGVGTNSAVALQFHDANKSNTSLWYHSRILITFFARNRNSFTAGGAHRSLAYLAAKFPRRYSFLAPSLIFCCISWRLFCAKFPVYICQFSPCNLAKHCSNDMSSFYWLRQKTSSFAAKLCGRSRKTCSSFLISNFVSSKIQNGISNSRLLSKSHILSGCTVLAERL